MTKEQAIKELRICECYSVEPSVEALDLAIKSLEQQSSDDCISRQAVLDLAVDYGTNSATFLIPVCSVKNLPSVTPARKQSEWYLRGGKFTCKKCEERALLKLTDATGGSKEYSYYTSNFCPNCGAEMRGDENEEK